MADAVKPTTFKKFMREVQGDRKGSGYKFYDDLDSAINDNDPRALPLVYEGQFELLGEIKLQLVPINSSGEKDAVRVVVKTGDPKEQNANTKPSTRRAKA